MDDFRRIQETQRINRIKASNDCLTCEVVITKEFKEAPISIVQGNGGPIEMAQMVKTLTDVAESLKKEFPWHLCRRTGWAWDWSPPWTWWTISC